MYLCFIIWFSQLTVFTSLHSIHSLVWGRNQIIIIIIIFSTTNSSTVLVSIGTIYINIYCLEFQACRSWCCYLFWWNYQWHKTSLTFIQGRQFDKDGNLVEWWEPDTKKKYLEKAKCIIEQYGNYTEEETGMHVSSHPHRDALSSW